MERLNAISANYLADLAAGATAGLWGGRRTQNDQTLGTDLNRAIVTAATGLTSIESRLRRHAEWEVANTHSPMSPSRVAADLACIKKMREGLHVSLNVEKLDHADPVDMALAKAQLAALGSLESILALRAGHHQKGQT